MKDWYSITAKGEAAAEISIFGPIGATWDGEGVTAKKFIEDFKALKAPNVTMTVNSPGGSLFDGLAIYTALAASGKTITAKVMGLAASAASLVLMAAQRIEMPRNTHLMIHKAGNVVAGNADDLRAMADVLDTLDDSIAATYAARTGRPVDEIKALLDQGDTWLNADEAVAMGFADEATELVTVTAQFDTAKLPEAVRAALAPPAAPAPAAAAQSDLPSLLEKLIADAGLSKFSAEIALDPRVVDEASARAAVEDAKAITVFAKLARLDDLAPQLIAQHKTVAEARQTLQAARAAADERTPIDTSPPPASRRAADATTFSPTALWADIEANKARSYQ